MYVFNCMYMTNLFDFSVSVAYILHRYLKNFVEQTQQNIIFLHCCVRWHNCMWVIALTWRAGDWAVVTVHCCRICCMAICHLWSVWAMCKKDPSGNIWGHLWVDKDGLTLGMRKACVNRKQNERNSELRGAACRRNNEGSVLYFTVRSNSHPCAGVKVQWAPGQGWSCQHCCCWSVCTLCYWMCSNTC